MSKTDIAGVVHEIVCPHCGSIYTEIVEELAPKDEKQTTEQTWIGGVGGAMIGGAAGSIFGPGGTIAGVVLGGLFGGGTAKNKAESYTVSIECLECGSTSKRRLDQKDSF